MRLTGKDFFGKIVWVGGTDQERCERLYQYEEGGGNATTVDAAPVVSCKDCKYWEKGDCYRLEMSKPNDFCSYGEKEQT